MKDQTETLMFIPSCIHVDLDRFFFRPYVFDLILNLFNASHEYTRLIMVSMVLKAN